MNECKRMTVYAMANGIVARNGNHGECTGEVGKCGCTHAEINLLKMTGRIKSITLSHSPCLNCAVALVNAGIEEVKYINEYRDTEGLKFLGMRFVEIKKLERNDDNVEITKFKEACREQHDNIWGPKQSIEAHR